jgi:biopolymer transport protein ExbD
MPLKTQRDDQARLDLTPMIDVVFLLIIFFMVATKFTEVERNIELELPLVSEAGTSAPPQKPRVVLVAADGALQLDGEAIELTALASTLAVATRQSADVEVVVHGDAHCDFQHIAAAMAACREGGVTQLGITVETATALDAAKRKVR